MLDRQKVEVVLTRRFPGASAAQVAAAANAIMGLDDEWEEVDGDEYPDLDVIARRLGSRVTLKLLKRRA
jgi:hypothetical protein